MSQHPPGRHPTPVQREALSVCGKVAFALVAMLGTAVGVRLGHEYLWQSAVNAGLHVPEEALDFGEVWVTDDFIWTLPLHNPTSDEVVIEAVLVSRCLKAVEPPSFTIPAGGSTEVRLTLDLTQGCSAKQLASPIRPFTVQLRPVIANAVPQQPGWEIRGEIRSPLLVRGWVLDFGDGFVRGSPPHSKAVRINTDPRVRDFLPKSDPAIAEVKVRRTPGATGQFDVCVTPVPELATGPFSFPLILSPVLEDGRVLPKVRLRVEGHVVDELSALPNRVIFGVVRLGEIVEESVSLRSRLGEAWEVVSYRSTSPAVTLTPVPRPAPTDMRYLIRLRPRSPGSQVDQVTFRLRHVGGSNAIAEVVVTVHYHGLGSTSKADGKK